MIGLQFPSTILGPGDERHTALIRPYGTGADQADRFPALKRRAKLNASCWDAGCQGGRGFRRRSSFIDDLFTPLTPPVPANPLNLIASFPGTPRRRFGNRRFPDRLEPTCTGCHENLASRVLHRNGDRSEVDGRIVEIAGGNRDGNL